MKYSFATPFALWLLGFLAYQAKGQFNGLTSEPEWCKGSVTLKGNKRLTGYVQNNDKLGLIKFKTSPNTEESEIESFQEKSLLAMEYWDSQRSDYRKFYSINCKFDEVGFMGYLLFEVVKEYKNFAVLTRVTRVNLIEKDNSGMEGYSKTAGLMTTQAIGFFCLGESAELEPFLIVRTTETDKIMFDKSKTRKFYDEDVIKKFLGAHWTDVKAYGKKSNLSFSDHGEILPLLTYYEKLDKEN